jgi:FdhD protein
MEEARERTGALVGRHPVCRVGRRTEPVGWEEDDVVTEYPLTLVVNGTEMATLVCSPSHLEELVLGFLTAEGVLRPYEPLDRLFVDREEGMAFVEAPGREGTLEQEMFGKRYVGSCCGKSRTGFYFANDARTARPVVTDLTVTAEDCFRLMDELQRSSPVFARTGGVHNAGLGTPSELEVVRTDIGRHNTLDKLYGNALREGMALGRRIVPFSGRVSSEVLLKVAKMGCPVLVSKSAPTLLALEMAGDLGVTVVGFAGSDRFNLYTHPGRIRGAPGT